MALTGKASFYHLFMQRNIFSVPSKHLLSLIFDTKFSELQQSAVLSVVDSISQIPGGLLTTLDFFYVGLKLLHYTVEKKCDLLE